MLVTWLPASSTTRVQELDVSNSCITELQAGMQALRFVDVSGCSNLAASWLLVSSAGRVRYLDMADIMMLAVLGAPQPGAWRPWR